MQLQPPNRAYRRGGATLVSEMKAAWVWTSLIDAFFDGDGQVIVATALRLKRRRNALSEALQSFLVTAGDWEQEFYNFSRIEEKEAGTDNARPAAGPMSGCRRGVDVLL